MLVKRAHLCGRKHYSFGENRSIHFRLELQTTLRFLQTRMSPDMPLDPLLDIKLAYCFHGLASEFSYEAAPLKCEKLVPSYLSVRHLIHFVIMTLAKAMFLTHIYNHFVQDRPLPRQGADRQPDRAALCQPHL